MSVTYKQILDEFKEWSPEHAAMVIDYRPWGSSSIVVWLNNGLAYKVKRTGLNEFVMQVVSKEDIANKFNI